jgi:Flp pilus assembly pilin Flp
MDNLRATDFWIDELGQDAVEYALLIGFVVVASAAGIATVLTALGDLWTAMNGLLSSTS